jgi:UDP-N-acetylglucosamine 2-epimerase
MRPLKVTTAVGARPQFIKAAAVTRAIAQHNAACPEQAILVTVILYVLMTLVEAARRAWPHDDHLFLIG